MSDRASASVEGWQLGMLVECVDATGAVGLEEGRRYRVRSVDLVPFSQGERKVGIRLEGVVRPDYVNGEGAVLADYPFGSKRFRPVSQ